MFRVLKLLSQKSWKNSKYKFSNFLKRKLNPKNFTFYFTSILAIKKNRGYRFGRWPRAINLQLRHSNFWRGSENRIGLKFGEYVNTRGRFLEKKFWVGRHLLSYPTCMPLLVPFLCICALFCVATPVNYFRINRISISSK